jgi:hypothetical protein
VDDAERFRLLGKYKTPKVRYGRRARSLVRGEVTVCGLTDALIPWPIGAKHAKCLVVYGDLARAVRRESNQAVAYWWGITPQTVTIWRKALGVEPSTAGTSRLRRDYAKEPWAREAIARAQGKAQDPDRRAKIAAAKRGKPRPAHVGQAVAEAHRGTQHTAETRARMSTTHKARGTLVPGTRVWTPEEDDLARTLPPEETAQRTGRSVVAVRIRRRVLGVAGH